MAETWRVVLASGEVLGSCYAGVRAATRRVAIARTARCGTGPSRRSSPHSIPGVRLTRRWRAWWNSARRRGQGTRRAQLCAVQGAVWSAGAEACGGGGRDAIVGDHHGPDPARRGWPRRWAPGDCRVNIEARPAPCPWGVCCWHGEVPAMTRAACSPPRTAPARVAGSAPATATGAGITRPPVRAASPRTDDPPRAWLGSSRGRIASARTPWRGGAATARSSLLCRLSDAREGRVRRRRLPDGQAGRGGVPRCHPPALTAAAERRRNRPRGRDLPRTLAAWSARPSGVLAGVRPPSPVRRADRHAADSRWERRRRCRDGAAPPPTGPYPVCGLGACADGTMVQHAALARARHQPRARRGSVARVARRTRMRTLARGSAHGASGDEADGPRGARSSTRTR